MKEEKQPRPIMNAAAWVALIMAAVSMLITFGWITWDNEQKSMFENFITLLIPALPAIIGPLLVWWRSESKVTPLEHPRDNELVLLVREDGKEIVR